MIRVMLYLGHCFSELLIATQAPPHRTPGRHWKSGSQRSSMEFQDAVAIGESSAREPSLLPLSLN